MLKRNNEVFQLSIEEIIHRNNKTLTAHENTPAKTNTPGRNTSKITAVPFETARRFLEIVRNHEVVAPDKAKYRQQGCEIGYCFGRATYLHLILLKLGIDKSALRKVWAVGPMSTNQPHVNWDFHVAISVLTKEKGWVTLDVLKNQPEPVRDWFNYLSDRSLDQRLRFYVTLPKKFTASIGVYNRVELGLDLSREQDWYRHYFIDLLRSVSEISVEELRRNLPRENTPVTNL